MAKWARIKVSKELLVKMLQLPDETNIINAKGSEGDNTVQFILEHPNIPDLKAGDNIPLITPIYHKIITEFDWNYKKE